MTRKQALEKIKNDCEVAIVNSEVVEKHGFMATKGNPKGDDLIKLGQIQKQREGLEQKLKIVDELLQDENYLNEPFYKKVKFSK
ncbi:MAG: hypothetical protein ACE5HI_06340 [bacterium]